MNPDWVEEHTNRLETDREAEKKATLDGLKREINDFLWIRLAPEITMYEADLISSQIYAAIENGWVRGVKK